MRRVGEHSIQTIKAVVDVSMLNLAGRHAIAKKGGDEVAYQGGKKAKTSNIMPMGDAHGYRIISTGSIAGTYNYVFQLKA